MTRDNLSLGPYDIVCGRCGNAFNNIGNRRFRVTIRLNLQRYNEAKSRQERSEVILSIVNMLKNDAGARFVKRSNSKKSGEEFVELDDRQTRQKVGHALRDMAVQKADKLFSSASTINSYQTSSTVGTKKTMHRAKTTIQQHECKQEEESQDGTKQTTTYFQPAQQQDTPRNYYDNEEDSFSVLAAKTILIEYDDAVVNISRPVSPEQQEIVELPRSHIILQHYHPMTGQLEKSSNAAWERDDLFLDPSFTLSAPTI